MIRSKRISLFCTSLLSFALAVDQVSAVDPAAVPISKKNRRFRLTASTKDSPDATTPAPGATPAPAGATPAPALPADGNPVDPSVLIPPPGVLAPQATPNPAKVALMQKPLPPVPTRSDASERAAAIEASISQSRITLLDAVRMTLLKNTSIKLTAEDVAQARAQLHIATGQFDFQLTGSASYSRTQTEQPDNQKQSVYNDYGQKQTQRDIFKQTIAQTQKNISQLQAGQDLIPDTSSITDPKLRADADLQNQVNLESQQLGDQLLRAVATPDQLAQLDKIKADGRLLSIATQQDTLASVQQSYKQLIDQLAKFPPITVQRVETALYSMQLMKELRNGVSLGAFADFSGTNDNVTRRSGTGNTNVSHIGLVLNVPFGQGSGAAASAQERSAAVTLEASRLNLQHTISSNVLQTVLAYWNIVAAQQRLQLLLRSELINGTLVELSRELIKADSIAASDISQIEAQRAISRAQRIAAEQDLMAATQAMAVNMGMDLNAIMFAPLAGEGFPELIPADTLKTAPRQAFATTALWNRADRLASLKAEQSGRILVEAAKINLRPNVGFQAKASYSSVTQGSNYEQYLGEAYDRLHGPSFSAALSLAWPLENNAAKGNLEQTSSVYNQNTIQTDTLSRSIISSVVVDLSGLLRARQEIQSAQEAADGFEKAFSSEREKFKLGNSTLIDAIQVEQSLTSARLQLVSARLAYASTLAQLRFDTGTLIPRAKELMITKDDLVTLPPVNGVTTTPPGLKPFPEPPKAKTVKK